MARWRQCGFSPELECSDQKVMQTSVVNFYLKSGYLKVPIANLKAFSITSTRQEAVYAIKSMFRKVRAVFGQYSWGTRGLVGRSIWGSIWNWKIKGPGRTEANSNICQFFEIKKIGTNFAFLIFGGGSIKLVFSDQTFFDWLIRQSQTHLPLLRDKEKKSRSNYRARMDRHRMIRSFRVFVEFCISFSANNVAFFILLVHYQRYHTTSIQLIISLNTR